MTDHEELLWRQYNLHVDLYKHYLDYVLKVNIFYYGITGALLAFYFTNIEKSAIGYSLLLPAVMSFLFLFLCVMGACLLRNSRKKLSI